jgi:hypothetical protein
MGVLHYGRPMKFRALAGALRGVVALGALWLLLRMVAAAQDLEPRAYSPSPVGTSFVGFSYSRLSGDIAFDPTVPITNAHATLDSSSMGLGQTIGLLGRQAMIVVGLPYVWGTATGDVGDLSGSIYRSGMADIKTRFSLNLMGVPAMTPKEFAQRNNRKFIMAASLSISWPTGQYGSTKLINLGTNRWAFKPEIGISYPVKKLDLDAYYATTFFSTNESFYPGQSVRAQDFLSAVQGHVSYTVKPRLWVAVDSTWYGGGATRLNGAPPTGRQGNSRLGATVSLPLWKGQSLKASYSSGVSGTIGQKFDQLGVGWQYVWVDRRWWKR